MDKVIQTPVTEKVVIDGKEIIAKFGCSLPIRFCNSDGGITTYLPEKQKKENIDGQTDQES